MNPELSQLAIGEERIPADETANIDELLAVMRQIQEEHDASERTVRRSVHPKQHGCVWAEFCVEPDLPEELRHGLFREARVFPALMRFSNSKQKDDRLPDGHGAAIKLFDVGGPKLIETERDATTHDFIFVDHPVFFARDVADLVPLANDFRRLMIGGPVEKTTVVVKAMASQDYRFRLIRKMGAKRPDNPLDVQYWSTTPCKFGEGAMKFSLRPQLDSIPLRAENSPDKFRLAMKALLKERAASFDFLIQLQADPIETPIEDASIEWDEQLAPWQKVATVRIPQQTFDSAEKMAFGEGLSFTPWHAAAEHRPLGGINRARKVIYETMSARRLQLNGIPKHEPTLEDVRAVFPEAWPTAGA